MSSTSYYCCAQFAVGDDSLMIVRLRVVRLYQQLGEETLKCDSSSGMIGVNDHVPPSLFVYSDGDKECVCVPLRVISLTGFRCIPQVRRLIVPILPDPDHRDGMYSQMCIRDLSDLLQMNQCKEATV